MPDAGEWIATQPDFAYFCEEGLIIANGTVTVL